MKKQNQNIVLFLLFGLNFLFFTRIDAQSCYIRLSDAAGITPTQAQLAALESAACRLRDSLPVAFQDSFKVYDFGFYLHNETMVGGYPEMFQAAITQVETQSPYYLLFGKQTDRTGIYTKFWVAMKLPNQDIFYCIDRLSPSLRSDLIAKYGIIANAVHDANQKAYIRYHETEIATIDSLRSYITALKECCIPPGQQRRGPSCTSCAFSLAEFRLLLNQRGFIETQGLIKSEVAPNPANPEAINRIIKLNNGSEVNVDNEIQQYVDAFMKLNPSKGSSVYKFKYPDNCVDVGLLFAEAEDDTASLVIVATLLGEVGQQGGLHLKIYEKPNLHIEPNGPGKLYFFDMHGKFLMSEFGNQYHGIYFTDMPYMCCLWLNYKNNTGKSKGDRMAEWSSFFLSDENINFLKDKQKQCNSNNREYGGLVSLGAGKGTLNFEECTWCSATSVTLNGSLDILSYPSYKSKEFVAHWHTHPDAANEESQTPSGWTRAVTYHVYEGDYFLFKNQSAYWQGDYLVNSGISPENTYSLPGRIGIIAGDLGITVYRFAGDYYDAVGPPLSGSFTCSYHPKNVCYQKQGTIANLNLVYKWVTYNLSQIKL